MRSSAIATAFAALGLALALAACSSPAAGTAARPAGVLQAQHSAVGTSSVPGAGRSTALTTAALASITVPDPSASAETSEHADDGAPSTYSPPPAAPQATIDGWVAQFTNGAAFLGWTVTGSTVSGTFNETFLRAGDTTLTTDSASFNGSISGTSVTLTFSHGFGSTVSAQLTGDTLSLSVPQTDGSIQVEVYHPGTTADYNAEVQVVQASAAQLQQQSASAASVASEESASSAAAAAVQQQASNDQQAEQSAISSLAQDANFDSDLSSIADDVKTTAADLAQTRADAKAGGGDDCENASTTVYNDAATTVYNDAATTLYNDVLTLSNDIATAQTGISDLQSAEKQLEADGVQSSPDAASTLSAAQGAIAAATTAANAGIDKVNKSVSTAYAVANSIATGPCANQGPGDAPTPLAHI